MPAVVLAVDGRVATLTVDRPEVRNALDGPTVEQFHRALDEARAARAVAAGRGAELRRRIESGSSPTGSPT